MKEKKEPKFTLKSIKALAERMYTEKLTNKEIRRLKNAMKDK